MLVHEEETKRYKILHENRLQKDQNFNYKNKTLNLMSILLLSS